MNQRAALTRPPPSVTALCARHGNEEAHTRQVAAHALRLFDATRQWLGLDPADRPLLEAAARLHDVAFRDDPAHHALASARLVRRLGVAEIARADWPVLAAVMVQHAGPLPALAAQPLLRRLPPAERERARRLGAILRVADALDFSHLQDAAIHAVRRVRGTTRVVIVPGRVRGTLARAAAKADLWRAVYGVGLEFSAAPVAADQRPPLVTPTMSLPEAARRLLMLQFKLVVSNVAGAVDGTDIEALHDLRVAIRRWRAVWRLFRDAWPVDPAPTLSKRLGEVGRALGPARDLDVWLARLGSEEVVAAVAGHRGWRQFVAWSAARRRLESATVRRTLHGRRFSTLKLHLARLLRADLVGPAAGPSPAPWPAFAARQVRRATRRVLAAGDLRRSTDPTDVHRLRIRLRLARYAGEFFGPVLGPATQQLTKRLHAVERVLARAHDLDVALARLHEGVSPPRKLVILLQARRAAAQLEIEPTWRRLAERRFQRRVRRELKAWRRAARDGQLPG
jgi:CHAD domain-containing protein